MARTGIVTLLALGALAAGTAASPAATAHNSQAGAYGNTSHMCAPTPYFAEGGCVSAAVQDDRRYPFWLPPEEEREGRRLVAPGE